MRPLDPLAWYAGAALMIAVGLGVGGWLVATAVPALARAVTAARAGTAPADAAAVVATRALDAEAAAGVPPAPTGAATDPARPTAAPSRLPRLLAVEGVRLTVGLLCAWMAYELILLALARLSP